MTIRHLAFLVTRILILAIISSIAAGLFLNESNRAFAGSALTDEQIYKTLSSGRRVADEKEYIVPEQPTVYLTFDDGPTGLTPKVLDILAEEGIPATFFVVGSEAEAHKEVVKRIVREGHALGNHTYNHVYQQLYASFQAFWNQVQKTEDILERITGEKTTLVRAPGGTAGNFDPFYHYYLSEAGYTVYDWNIDSEDSRRVGVPAKDILATVRKGPFRHEMTVLLHDGVGHEESIKALPEIISIFKDKGYRFAAITPDVKPNQFATSPSKWSRSYSLDKHLSTVAEMRAHKPKKEVVAAAATPTPTPTPAPDLKLSINSKDKLLTPNDYSFRNNAFSVPLRDLVENMGGQVIWNDRTKTAAVRYGFSIMEYNLAKKVLTVHSLGGKVKTYSMADIQNVNGTLMVPIRQTVERLGEKIASYSMNSKPYEVNVVTKKLEQLNSAKSLN